MGRKMAASISEPFIVYQRGVLKYREPASSVTRNHDQICALEQRLAFVDFFRATMSIDNATSLARRCTCKVLALYA